MPTVPSSHFERVNTPRAFEQVCNQIRSMLANGSLKPGDKLPAERELATRLGVARSVLREGLRSLEIAGLISQRKGGTGGSFVTNVRSDKVKQAFEDMLILGSIRLGDLTEARSLIMVDAVALACERATEADFEALRRNIDETEAYTEAGDRERRRRAALEFYRLIGSAAKNEVILVAVEAVTATVLQFLRTVAGEPLAKLIEHRRRLLRHLRARDVAKASREITTFLAGVHQAMFAFEARQKAPDAPAMKTVPRRPKAREPAATGPAARSVRRPASSPTR